MSAKQQPEILIESDISRVVNLSRSFVFSSYEETIVELSGNVTFVRLREGRKAKNFVLQLEEMETLVSAYAQWKSAMATKEEQEGKEVAKRLSSLRSRLAALDGIMIPSGGDNHAYALYFIGRWAHRSENYVFAHTIGKIVDEIEATLQKEKELGRDLS